MKRKLFIIINLLFILCFTGCTYGSEFTVGSVESNTLTSMSMEYLKFSGNKNTTTKRIRGVVTRCVVLKLQEETPIEDVDLL